jgi:hypothetical protein
MSGHLRNLPTANAAEQLTTTTGWFAKIAKTLGHAAPDNFVREYACEVACQKVCELACQDVCEAVCQVVEQPAM